MTPETMRLSAYQLTAPFFSQHTACEPWMPGGTYVKLLQLASC